MPHTWGPFWWRIRLYNPYNSSINPILGILRVTIDRRIIYCRKSIVWFLPRLGFTSYLFCCLFHTFLTTKRRLSDIQCIYNSIFRLLKLVVYPVGQSTDWFCFVQMFEGKFDDLVQICTKSGTVNRLWEPYKCAKFQLNRIKCLQVMLIFVCVCVKRQG